MSRFFYFVLCAYLFSTSATSHADTAITGNLMLSGNGNIVFPDGTTQCSSAIGGVQCDAVSVVPQMPLGLQGMLIYGGIDDVNHGHALAWQQGGYSFLTSFMNSQISSTGSSFDLIFGAANTAEYTQSDATEKMRLVGATGNVGIGTAEPTEKLEVNGDIKAAKFKGDGSQITGITASQTKSEPELGNPLSSGYVLSSSLDGTRTWVPMQGIQGDKGEIGLTGPTGAVGTRIELGDASTSGRITFAAKNTERGPSILDSESLDDNVVTMFGYNQLPYYKVSREGEPGLAFTIEGNYDRGAGESWMEAYLQYLNPINKSVMRPFMTVINRKTHLPITTTLSGGDALELNLIDGIGPSEQQRVVGKVALGIYPAGITAYKPATFMGGLFADDTISISKYTASPITKSISIGGGIDGINQGHTIAWQQGGYGFLTSFLNSQINSTGSSFDLVFGVANKGEYTRSDASEKMRLVGATGNVGIGNTAPSEKLEVNGFVKAAGFKGDGSQITGIVKSIAGRTGAVIITTADVANPTEYDNGICTSTAIISEVNGPSQKITLGSDCTISWIQPKVGTFKILLKVYQGGSSNTVIYNSTKWPSGIAPVNSVGIGAIDIISCYLDGTSVFCQASLNFK